jgi:hypothetical protein
MNDARDQATIDAVHGRLVDGALAGAVATLLTSALVLIVAGVRLPPGATPLAAALRGHGVAASLVFTLHLIYGSAAGGLFVAGARRASIAGAVTFALALWALAACVYAPLIGLGFVAARAPGLAAFALAAHGVWGVALGALTPQTQLARPTCQI